jgi:hypothetical protein
VTSPTSWPYPKAAPQWSPSITASSLECLSGHEGADDGVPATHGRFSARVMRPSHHLPTGTGDLIRGEHLPSPQVHRTSNVWPFPP